MTSQFVQERRGQRGIFRSALRKLMPRDQRFQPLFDSHARLCVEVLEAVRELLADVRDPNGRVREIEAIEKRADSIVSETHSLLRRSVLPPFPRPAIHTLVNRLDDIADLAEDVAQSLHLYHVTTITPEARRLADLAVKSAVALQAAVAGLADAEDARPVLAHCEDVDAIEAQADHVFRSA